MTITVYSFRVRTEKGKWRVARYKMTVEEAHAMYGTGNYKMVPGTSEVRKPSMGTGHVFKTPAAHDDE